MVARNLGYRVWDGTSSVAATEVRKMEAEAMKKSAAQSRDACVENLAASGQWFVLLPAAVDPRMAGRSVRILGPKEYLELAVSCGEADAAGLPQAALVVNGDFELEQKRGAFFLSGKRVGLSKGGVIASLPPAVVRGDLRVTGVSGLKGIYCAVTGDTALQRCPDLEKIQGECFGAARFSQCGMRHLAAGYRCARDLRVAGCGNLRVLNCEVGGNLTVSSSPIERTGGGMQVGGDLFVAGNRGSLEVRGKVAGRISHEGVCVSAGALPRGTSAADPAVTQGPAFTNGTFAPARP